MPQHHQRDFTSLKVLLVTDVLVRRDHDFKPRLLGGLDQFAVFEFFPAARPRLLHGVAGEKTRQASGRSVVEKN